MDPNETLKRMLEEAQAFLSWDDSRVDPTPESLAADVAYVAGVAQALAEGTLALDDWLCNGGFLPRRWSRSTCAPRDGKGGSVP